MTFRASAKPTMLSIGLIAIAMLSPVLHWRRLPFQNAIGAASILLVAACGIELLASTTGLPFRPAEALNGRPFNFPPFSAAGLWVIIVVHSRKIAELVLHRYRRGQFHGYWLLMLAALIAGTFWLGLECLLHSAPNVRNLPGRLMSAVVLLLISVPWLLDKRDAFGNRTPDHGRDRKGPAVK